MLDRGLRELAARWLRERCAAVLVEVVAAQGSVPRGNGTRMLVTADVTAGTIGGGHLELKAIDEARTLLAACSAETLLRHYPLGPALGQCCGGAVGLRFELLSAAHVEAWPLPAPRFHLQLFGAGHVGRAIARLLTTLDVSVDWIDERDDEFPATLTDAFTERTWPAHIRRVAIDGVEAEVRHAPPGAFYLVLTHRHDLDQRITEAILRRNDFAFLGLIGSKTKRQRFIHRFEVLGIPAETIARMTCPIGIAGIDGKAPEVIAVAVVAQLLAQSRAHSA